MRTQLNFQQKANYSDCTDSGFRQAFWFQKPIGNYMMAE